MLSDIKQSDEANSGWPIFGLSFDQVDILHFHLWGEALAYKVSEFHEIFVVKPSLPLLMARSRLLFSFSRHGASYVLDANISY